MAYTIAAYWNSSEIQSTLNAVSAIMYGNAYGSDYGMLLNIMGTFGLLAAMFAVWIKLQPSEAGNHLFVIILVYFGLFVPRVQVVIEERAGTVTGGPVSVDNVPLALAAFASFATQSGDWLRQAYETVFQPVDALRFGPNGMVFGSRVIDASRGIGIADPALDRDMMNFVRECVNPDFSSGYYSITDFVREPDLWSAIQNTYVPNPGRAVLVRPQGNPSAAPDLFNCQEAVTQLNDYLRVEATNRLGYLGRVMFPQLSAANANTSIAAALPAAEGALLASSQDAATSVLQKMMINLFRDATQSIPATLNNPAAVQAAVGQAMAEQEALSSYRTMAKLADETLPSLRNAVQIVLFALFPLVIPICLLAGAKSGGKAFMTYALLLFWVELWPLLYAIVNFIRTSRDASVLQGMSDGVQSFTLANYSALTHGLVSGQAVAGLMSISVPFIALAIVMGGAYVATAVVSQLMAPASAAAQRAGGAAGVGNVTTGNVAFQTASLNNVNSSGWNTAGRLETGMAPAVSNQAAGSHVLRTADGSVQTAADGRVTDMKANMGSGTVTAGTTATRSDTDSSSSAVKASTSRSAGLDISQMAGSSDRASAEFARRLSTEIGTRMGAGQRAETRSDAGADGAASSEVSTQSGTDTSNMRSLQSQIGVDARGSAEASATRGVGGAPGGKSGASSMVARVAGALGLNAGTAWTMNDSQKLVDSASGTHKSSDRATRSEAAGIVRSAADEVAKTTNDAGVRAAADNFSASFDRATRATDGRSASVGRDDTAGNMRSQGTSNQVGGSSQSSLPVAQQAIGLARAELGAGASNDQVLARALQIMNGDPAALAGATAAAAGELKGSPTGEAVLGAGDAHAPRAPAAVQAQGDGQVNALSGRAHVAAAAADTSNRAAVAARQPAAPDSQPDTTPAERAHAATATAGQTAHDRMRANAALMQGVDKAAAALYRANEQGSSTVLSNAYLAGLGYTSPQQYHDALVATAAHRPGTASLLAAVGEGRVQLSGSALESLALDLKQHKAGAH